MGSIYSRDGIIDYCADLICSAVSRIFVRSFLLSEIIDYKISNVFKISGLFRSILAMS